MINTWDVPDVEDTKVFHAGTRLDGDRTVTAGGRVLCVCALGDSVAHAQQRDYAEVAGISWPGEFHRHDIGWRAIEIGREHVGTPVNKAHLVCRLLLEKQKKIDTTATD